MPTISRFYGITIQMFHKEHGIPHFHARYADETASFSVGDLIVLEVLCPHGPNGSFATGHGSTAPSFCQTGNEHAPASRSCKLNH